MSRPVGIMFPVSLAIDRSALGEILIPCKSAAILHQTSGVLPSKNEFGSVSVDFTIFPFIPV